MCQVGTLRFILLLPQAVVHGTDTKGCLLCTSVILTASTIYSIWYLRSENRLKGSEKAKHTESPSVTATSFLAAPREKVTMDRLNRVGRIEWLLGSVCNQAGYTAWLLSSEVERISQWGSELVTKAVRQQLFLLRPLRRFEEILLMRHQEYSLWLSLYTGLNCQPTRTSTHSRRKAQRIIFDPSHILFTHLPLGRQYRSIQTHSSRFSDSF